MAQGMAAAGAQQQQLQTQLSQVRRQAEDDKKKAVMEALRRFRYHVYTRYSWDEGKGFAAKGIITDVYDDGRFTYIRLNQPNRGLLSVETEIGEKNAVVPTKYDDAYGMYVISGIYPKFSLKADEAQINVTRSDSRTNGEF
ncbi:Conjugal transfer protein [compost metagenome]